MKCPKCGSENVQFATSTSGGGFSFGNACCGYILAGPLGILCGACGSSVQTDEFWICHNCGNRFTEADIKNHEREVQAQIRQEVKAANEYQHNKKVLEAVGKTHEEIESDYIESKEEYAFAAKNYQRLLDMYAKGPDKRLRKYARILKIETLKILFWILLCFGIFLLFSGVDFGLAIAIASIVLLVICYPVAKKAKHEIAKVDPDILTKQKAVETAEEKKDVAESLHKTSQAVKDYESKKDPKQ